MFPTQTESGTRPQLAFERLTPYKRIAGGKPGSEAIQRQHVEKLSLQSPRRREIRGSKRQTNSCAIHFKLGPDLSISVYYRETSAPAVLWRMEIVFVFLLAVSEVELCSCTSTAAHEYPWLMLVKLFVPLRFCNETMFVYLLSSFMLYISVAFLYDSATQGSLCTYYVLLLFVVDALLYFTEKNDVRRPHDQAAM